ncbi:hypothetical protein [Streptomyces sp. NPDC058644]|uniref:hypothetical protein n=1 Tax=unclassified Streptomyces TaxID=2593676 RepID=UPI00365FC977
MTLSDREVRERLREHQDGGPVSLLYETGAIGESLLPTLGLRVDTLAEDGRDEDAERLGDVITYVAEIGERPAVPNWVNRSP